MNAVLAGQEYHAKVMQFAATNSQAAFDYFQKLAAARAPSEVIALTAAHLREQSDNLTARPKELAHLAQELAVKVWGQWRLLRGSSPIGFAFPRQAGLDACVSLPRHIAAQFA